MPLLSRSKVLRDVSVGSKPVEIQLRDDFIRQESDLEQLTKDPQTQALIKAAQNEAERIVAEAKEQAAKLLAQAEAERDAYVEAARQEGIEAGYQEGYAQGAKEAELLKDRAESLLAEARKAYRGVMIQAEPNLVQLSLLIAEKVIRRQVTLAEDIIVTVVRDLLKEVHAGETFFLHVHPSQINLLEEARQELLEATPVGAALHFVADKSISPGGCRLETDTGYFDATIEGQLLELKKLLQDGGADV